MAGFHPSHQTKVFICLAVMIAAATAYPAYDHWHRGPQDQSSAIAAEIGASWCQYSGYDLKSKLDDSRTGIYDCALASGVRCVTEDGGVASDQTAVVKILFSSTLGADAPECAI